jgi:hypothetical protein
VAEQDKPSVSEVTRRNIVDAIVAAGVEWWGRLPETEFLSRIYPLRTMPSTDHRPQYNTAYLDIKQHRENNWDWPDGWVFTDCRFNLLHGSDEDFLRFLCEMVHPVVRPDAGEIQMLVDLCNKYLVHDGWEIWAYSDLSGKPLFAARRLLARGVFGVAQAKRVADVVNAAYMNQQITRMANAIVTDPELAIGTAKEFLETICKTILAECHVAPDSADDLPRLVKRTMKQLKLTPDDVPDSAKAAETIRVTLSNLVSLTKGVTELRNLHGSGHGKHATTQGLSSRHARLAVGAATALGVFLFDTFQEQATNP